MDKKSKLLDVELTMEQRRNLSHALHHLNRNKIADPNSSGGWYCGSKTSFAKRHVSAIAMLEALLLKPNA